MTSRNFPISRVIKSRLLSSISVSSRLRIFATDVFIGSSVKMNKYRYIHLDKRLQKLIDKLSIQTRIILDYFKIRQMF